MVRYLFIFTLFAPLSSEARMVVGGSCHYDSYLGVAEVSRQADKDVQARFSPVEQVITSTNFTWQADMIFPVKEPTAKSASTGFYPASLAIINSGTCPPYQLRLLASEYFSQALFIPFSPDGNRTDIGQAKLRAATTLFTKLKPSWPRLHMEICGQTAQEGSQEYNLNLSSRYAARIGQDLLSAGLKADQLHSLATGEHGCPGMKAERHADLQHGVWLRLLLTGEEQRSGHDLAAAPKENNYE